jgi:hypothetical protein
MGGLITSRPIMTITVYESDIITIGHQARVMDLNLMIKRKEVSSRVWLVHLHEPLWMTLPSTGYQAREMTSS